MLLVESSYGSFQMCEVWSLSWVFSPTSAHQFRSFVHFARPVVRCVWSNPARYYSFDDIYKIIINYKKYTKYND